MNYLLKIIVWIVLVIFISHASDPDEEICNDTKLDSAVHAADGNTYIFKGQHFWRTKPLDKKKGIVGFAQQIVKKWPEVSPPIILSFTVKSAGAFRTVLVNKNSWFVYDKNNSKVVQGSTKSWPFFPTFMDVNTMFSLFSDSSSEDQIFLIYDDSKELIVYNLKGLMQLEVSKTGPTSVSVDKFLWFIDTPGSQKSLKDGKILKDLMNVKASLSYFNYLILLTEKNYCRVDLTGSHSEKKCEFETPLFDMLGCPLNLAKRSTKLPKNNNSTAVWTDSPTNSTPIDFQSSTMKKASTSSTGESLTADLGREQKQTNDETKNESKLTVPIIVGVLMVGAVIIFVVIIVFVFSKKSKSHSTANKKSVKNRQISESSIQTVDTNTGVPITSQTSIKTLNDNHRHKK